MEPLSATAIAAVSGKTALNAEVLATTALSTSASSEGLAATFGSKIFNDAEKGLSLTGLGKEALEQVTRMSICQVAGQLGQDNEALSLASRAVAAYACSALNFSPEKIKADAQKFDDLTGKENSSSEFKPEPSEIDLFDRIKNAVNTLGNTIKDFPLAKAMAYAGIMEAAKYTGNEAAIFVAPHVLDGFGGAYEKLTKDTGKSFNEFYNENAVSTLYGVNDLEHIKQSIDNNIFQYLQKPEFLQQLPETIRNDIATLSNMDAMPELQNISNEVCAFFNLKTLPVFHADLINPRELSNNAAFIDWPGIGWDHFAADPKLFMNFAIATAKPGISIEKIFHDFAKLVFAHEVCHYIFSKLPVKYPRAIEEYCCDAMSGIYAAKNGISTDSIKAFHGALAGNLELRGFNDNGEWMYPATMERWQAIDLLENYDGPINSLVLPHFAQIAAQNMNVKMEYNAYTQSYEIVDKVSAFGHSLEKPGKIYAELKTISAMTWHEIFEKFEKTV